MDKIKEAIKKSIIKKDKAIALAKDILEDVVADVNEVEKTGDLQLFLERMQANRVGAKEFLKGRRKRVSDEY